MIKSLRLTFARSITTALVSLALTLTAGLAPVSAAESPLLAKQATVQTDDLATSDTSPVTVQQPELAQPSADDPSVTITGTVVEIADGPADRPARFLETENGQWVPINTDDVSENLSSGVNATLTADVPEALLETEEAAASPAGVLVPASKLAEAALEAAADRAIELPVRSATILSEPVAAAVTTPVYHHLDFAFLSTDGRGRFWTRQELKDYVDALSSYWVRESRGLIAGFTYNYDETKYDTSTVHCTGNLDTISAASAKLFGETTVAKWGGNSKNHLITLSESSDHSANCNPNGAFYSGVARIGDSGLESGGPIHAKVDNKSSGAWKSSVEIIAHEFGHNLGLRHADAALCREGVVDGPVSGVPDPPCSFGDIFSWPQDTLNIMGMGDITTGLNGWQKEWFKIITEGQGLRTVQDSPMEETFTLAPSTTSDQNALQALSIIDTYAGGRRVYSVEYDKVAGGVVIRRINTGSDPEFNASPQTFILLSPDRGSRPQEFVYRAGKTFESTSKGLLISVTQVTSASAVVNVRLGPPKTPHVAAWPEIVFLSGSTASTETLITTNQSEWSATSDSDWLTLSTSGGTTGQRLTARLLPNRTDAQRLGVVTLRAGVTSATFTVLQLPDDYGDTKGTAGEWDVWANPVLTGKLETNEDIDFIRFTAPVSGSYRIDVSSELPLLFLELFRSTGDFKMNRGFGETNRSDITFYPNLIAGTSYYLLIESIDIFRPSKIGSYTITATIPDGPALSVFPTALSVPAEGGTTTTTVTTNQSNWEVDQTTVPAWLTFTTAGSVLSLTAQANTSTSSRSATVKVVAAGATPTTLAITQAGVPYTCSVTLSSLSLPATGGSHEFTISSNSYWHLESKPAWVTVSPESAWYDATVSITASANTADTVRRSGPVVFTCGSSNTATVSVDQAAVSSTSTLALGSSNLSAVAGGATVSTSVTTNQPRWTADVTAGVDWLSLGTASGSTGGDVSVIVAPNTSASPRQGTVTVTAGAVANTLTITQAGATPTLSVSSSGGTVAATIGSAATSSVTTNLESGWTLFGLPSWATASRTSGPAGTTNVTFTTTSANTNTTPRSANITISAPGMAFVTYTLTQAGAIPTLSVSSSSGTVAATIGSTATASVTTNVESGWTLSGVPSWATVSRTSGLVGTTNITFTTTSANVDTTPRSTTITISAPDATPVTYTLTQTGAAPSISLSPTSWSPSAASQDNKVAVTTNHTSWTASSNQSWLTVNPGSGTNGATTTVSVTTNTSTSARTGSITFSASGTTATLTVTQAGAPAPTPTVSLASSALSAPAGGSTVSTSVTTNQASWNAVVATGISWLTMNKASGSTGGDISIIVAPNTSTSSRQGTVMVTAGTATTTLTITQAAAPTVSLSTTTWEPTSGAQNTNVTVTTNQASWTASPNQSWLTVNPGSGTNGATPAVSVTANTSTNVRTGSITFSASGATTTLTVTQAGTPAPTPTVSLGSSTLSAPATGGTVLTSVTTNQAVWDATVTSGIDWLTVIKASGSTGGEVLVNVSPNPSASSRQGTVTVTAGTATATLAITQAAAATVSLSGSYMYFSGQANSFTVRVATNQAGWSAVTSVPWLMVSPAVGVSGGLLNVSVTANTSGQARSGTATVTAGGATATLLVEQNPTATASLTLSRTTTYAAPNTGGSITVTATTNQLRWNAQTTADWITVTPSTGQTKETFTVTAAGNSTSSSRRGTVTVTAGTVTRTLTITQAAGSLTINPSSTWAAPISGGNRNVTVTTSVPAGWRVTSDNTWITVTPDAGTTSQGFTVTAVANDGPARRATVTINAGGLSRSFTVTQAAATFTISPTSYAAAAAGSSRTITLTTSVPTGWRLTNNTGQTWVNLSTDQAQASQTITLTVQPNPTTQARSASLEFQTGQLIRYFTVTQSGSAWITPAFTAWTTDRNTAQITTPITTNQPTWTATTSARWITIGTTPQDLTITTTTNTGNRRTGTITLRAGSASTTINITQTG